MKTLELYWDVASPYTYLATTQLSGILERTGAELRLVPFLLGGVFKATSNHMPADVPAKASYMLQDLARWRDHYGVPFKLPVVDVVFPINSLLAMRIACAVEDQVRYLHAIMSAYWAEGIDIGTEAAVRAVLTKHGFDADRLVAAAQQQAIKDQLRKQTEEAVARGAFGAPAMFVGDEHFWGNDRLHFVEAALR